MARVEPVDPADVGKGGHHGGKRGSLSSDIPSSLGSDVNSASPDKRPPGSTVHVASAPGLIVYRTRHLVRRFLTQTGWHESPVVIHMRKFLRGKTFSTLTMICLFIALFLGEILSIAQVPTNVAQDTILMIVFAIFAFEWLGLSLTDTSYLFGFFFWMDLLGTGSMAFDISFMAGADVTQAVQVHRGGSATGSQNVIVVRATRAAKLGARAGRISRVVKVLRFLPFLLGHKESDEAQKVKMARVISNQLTNVLSTRVAFLTICIVIIMPLFTMFTYPEDDDSMSAWTSLLALNADKFYAAWSKANSTLVASTRVELLREASQCLDFYSQITYGPFDVQYGESAADGTFTSRADVLDLNAMTWSFRKPRRGSSARVVTQGRIQASFDLTAPKVQEAGSNIGLICLIIVIMCGFGLVMSSSISVIALQPLERMLSVVRERCTEIFKYTNNLQDTLDEEEEMPSEEYDDMEHDSEFVLLEKVVGKLAAIAHLSATGQEPEVKADMNENDIMVLNWMQGAQVPAMNTTTGSFTTGQVRGSGMPKGGSSVRGTQMSELQAPRATPTASLSMAVIEALDTAYFNPLDLTKEVRICVAHYLLCNTEGIWAPWARLHVSEHILWAFLGQVEAQYPPNPFHNFSHAVDVEYTVYRFLDQIEAYRFMTDTNQFCLLIAAVAHDVGHLALNNPYLIETSNELAVRYNDRSPLENMHCAKLFQIVSNPEYNVFSQVARDQYKEMRKAIIDAILHTDVTKHNEMIKELGMLYQMNSDAFDSLSPDAAVTSNAHIQLISSMVLHGADVGNPMKPWELCKKYAFLCMEEFFAQGDLEKSASIPVQMLNDRDKVNTPNAQIGFIEFFIAPMVSEMVHLFPRMQDLPEFLGTNINRWMEVWQEETLPAADAKAKVQQRVKKVVDNMKTLVKSARDLQLAAGAG